MANIVALLESMWGWRGYNEPGEDAPRYFRINAENNSGRRLYKLIGEGHSLLVTNCCRSVQVSANHHGMPDAAWVAANLEFLKSERMDLLLVCGRVAQATYAATGRDDKRILMDHPAARRWSSDRFNQTQQAIAAALR